MKIRKKLILAGLAVLSLLITTVTTTFAWFSLNDSAWVDDFEVEISNTDQLLVKHESGNFKQMLTTEDIKNAINDDRKEQDVISSINDIKLVDICSINGNDFYKIVPKYDEMNRKSLSFEKASLNSYLEFKLIFKVEKANSKEENHPNYYLCISDSEQQEGVKKTSFTASDQKITLINKLATTKDEYKMGDVITVNPVNSLRLSIKGDPEQSNSKVDYIYDLGNENDLGSYAIDEDILESLGVFDQSLYCSKSASFTYYNNINNDILNPLGYYNTFEEKEEQKKSIEDLLWKLKTDFKDNLGEFKYNQETDSYNDLSITIRIWIEGFDADNLIGLDKSDIKCLLSFKLKEVNADE